MSLVILNRSYEEYQFRYWTYLDVMKANRDGRDHMYSCRAPQRESES